MVDQIFPSISAILSLTAIGAVFGLILSVAKVKLKVDKDPRIELILDALPGANCGACGQPGCSGYASKVVLDGVDINLCPVGGDEVIHKLAGIMGLEATEGGPVVKARVHCQGGRLNTTNNFIYNGPKDCSASNNLMGGFLGCSYGCLGFGNCAKVCPFDAIVMSDNDLPVVDLEKCTGCGNCVTACPRDIISLIPENFDVWVGCMNREKGSEMKKGCSVGCIGCKMCVNKACKEVFEDNPDVESAITVDSFIASINYDVCTNCYKCAEVCPVPVINPLSKAKKKKAKPKVEKKEPAAVETKNETKAEAGV